MSAIFSTPPPGCTCCINNEVYEETPRQSFTKKSSTDSEKLDVSVPSCCNICLEPLAFTGCEYSTRDRAVTLRKCGHVFGRTCLDKWLEDATTCPMCRVEVKEDMEQFKDAFIGSVFATAGLMEEMGYVMAGRNRQTHGLMGSDSEHEIEDEEDGYDMNQSDDEGDHWESDREESDEKKAQKQRAESGEIDEQASNSGARTARFSGIRHIVA